MTHSNTFLKKKNKVILWIFILCLLISILDDLTFIWLFGEFPKYHIIKSSLINHSFIYLITSGVLIGPIIETFLFQFMIIYIIEKIGITNKIIILFIPAVIFALAHAHYGWLYAIGIFLVGLSYTYFYLTVRRNSKYYFWLTVLLHSSYNLFCVIHYFIRK